MTHSIRLSPIDEAIAEIAAGRPIIVVDDEDRENEGDLIVAAEKVTPEIINFFATQARGLICTPVDSEISARLDFHPMVQKNEESTGCNFAVSVDLREGIASGISAFDRATTIRHIVDPVSKPNDFVRPGHVFPLNAKDGGVLVRAGHTEATVDIARLAGLKPAGTLCEIMNEDGTMARLPELLVFAKKHDLKIISIEALIEYRRQKESLVEKVASATLPTVFGIFDVHVFREKLTETEHVAMVKGDISASNNPLVRVHSECLTGDVFRSLRCDCRSQLDAGLHLIAEEGTGIMLRMAQEGARYWFSSKDKCLCASRRKGF
jgi:3,4-dihydroxy 2-butanone 4-phosphate synthase/GTP cyclohydrolase II